MQEIMSAIGGAQFAVPPEFLYIPFYRHDLKLVRLETLLAEESAKRKTVKHPYTKRTVSLARIIANRSLSEDEISDICEGSHQCHWYICIIPDHLNPLPHAGNMACDDCRKRAI